MKKLFLAALCVAFFCFTPALAQEKRDLKTIEESLKADVPKILCIDERFASGGQPTAAAFEKLAANGFKSVLNLRTDNEGVDLEAEKTAAEKAGLRYISIPVVTASPDPKQIPLFFQAVKEAKNQPMFIHCGAASRVGALWLIYRVLEQGWTEEKALDEATKIGLTRPELKQFALDYIAKHKK